VQFAKPCFKVFTAKLVDVGVAVNLDVIPRLYHIDPVEHVQEPLTLDRHCEFFVKHVEEDIRSTLVRRANGEVVNLMFEEDVLPIDDPRVEAGFMNRWHEAQFLEDSVSMPFTKLWQLWMALHCGEDRDDLTRTERRAAFMLGPPLVERSIGANIEPLLGGRRLRKCVTDIQSKNEEILRGTHSLE
jgi:hypothetical protein